MKLRFILVWDMKEKDLRLEEFEREDVIAYIDKGQPVIPVWLDQIYQQLDNRLNERNESA